MNSITRRRLPHVFQFESDSRLWHCGLRHESQSIRGRLGPQQRFRRLGLIFIQTLCTTISIYPWEAQTLDMKRVQNFAVSPHHVDDSPGGRVINERFLADVLEYLGQVKVFVIVNPHHTHLDHGELIRTDVLNILISDLYSKGLDRPYNPTFDRQNFNFFFFGLSTTEKMTFDRRLGNVPFRRRKTRTI